MKYFKIDYIAHNASQCAVSTFYTAAANHGKARRVFSATVPQYRVARFLKCTQVQALGSDVPARLKDQKQSQAFAIRNNMP